MNIKRGSIFLANLEPGLGSEQGKIRPCLVIQNDIANEFSPTTIVAPITSTIPNKHYPTIVIIEPQESGLKKTSTVLCNQIRTVSTKHRMIKKLGTLKPSTMKKVDEALKTGLALE